MKGFDYEKIFSFQTTLLGDYCRSLVLAKPWSSGKEALVVDPDRDINAYLDQAKKHGLTIKGVFLTHSHADFVAGHLEFVRSLKVPIYQNAASGAKYKIEALQEGSSFKVGVATVKVMVTPGHTPDGMCDLVFSEGDAQTKAILTGDTLFVGSIGRPDLLAPAFRGSDTRLSLSPGLSHRHPASFCAHRAQSRSLIGFMSARSLARASASMVSESFFQNSGKSFTFT